MEVFNRDVDSYDELLKKRKEVNDLFKYIKNKDFVNMVIDTVSKQYNTILMEQQDINTLEDLTIEKERKLEALSEIDEENNSEEFQGVLRVLIENEKKRQERILEEKKKIEEEERKKKLEIEKRRQEEILKRQKIIEEARKKEMEKRTRIMLEQQQNSVLQAGKKKDFSFETIKASTKNNEIEKPLEEENKLELRMDRKIDKPVVEETVKEKEEPVILKDKIEIEKELFDEFKNQDKTVKPKNIDELLNNKVLEEHDEPVREKKLPDISIDEYMKNFDAKKIEDNNEFFGSNDVFPSIPM